MIGLEKNAGKVSLACYAPLLANVDYVNWKLANLIWFNNHQVLLTASYYIQKLFMNHQGDWQLPCTMLGDTKVEDWTEDGELTTGEIYFRSNGANVEYTDIMIKDSDNNILNVINQCNIDKNIDEFYAGKAECEKYTVSFKARQNGDEGQGFFMHFGRKNKDNMLTLSLGGWNKANNILNEVINGKPSCLSQYPFPLEVDNTYSVQIDVAGRQIVVSIDGVECQRITRKHILVEPLYYCSSVEDKTGDIILKVANLTEELREIDTILEGNDKYNRCKVYSMCGYSRDTQNVIGEPNVIKPKQLELEVVDNRLCYQIQPESFTLFRVSKSKK